VHVGSPAATKVPFLSALFAAQPEGPPLNAVATDSYVGERSDCPPLNALFLAARVAFKAASSSTPDGCPPRKSTAEVHAYHAVATGVVTSSLTKRAPTPPLGFPVPVAGVGDDSGG